MATYASLAESSADARDKTLVIRESRAGVVPIGGRSTALRLASGDTFVYVSHPHTAATEAALKQLGGEVKYLVTPDGEHDMNIEQWAQIYPEAQTIGVERLGSRRPSVKWAGLFGAGGESKTYGFEPEVTLHNFSAHLNHELIAIHHPTGTLLEGDMLFNLPPTEQFSRAGGLPFLSRILGGGSSLSPGGRVHAGMVKGVTKDRALAKEQLQPIYAAKWDRIIPCHGDVIETGGRAAWDKAWGAYK